LFHIWINHVHSDDFRIDFESNKVSPSARGGLYRNTPADTQAAWLKTVSGFLGLTDIEFVYAEGLAMGAEAAQKGLAEAEAQIEAIAG